MYKAEIILDSISPGKHRLTTFVVTFPRIVLAEANTHRVLTRNLSSQRAIPIKKTIAQVFDDPFLPVEWGANTSGMQAKTLLSAEEQTKAEKVWLKARDLMVGCVNELQDIGPTGVHKQIANRLLEPWIWSTAIISATAWSNFYKLRCHKDAQPEIKKIAEMMRDLHQKSTPNFLDYGEWHIPYGESNTSIEENLKIATGRIARVSYLTHDGIRDTSADIELHDKLILPGHWSPFEHCATPGNSGKGNFRGWNQYRHTLDLT
jgi:thymidylate synthase ThyX